MASETITRNDLTNILNEVLPFSFTEFRHHTGTATIPKSTLVQVHSETFESGSWLILTSLEVTSGGAVSTTGQNRILENGALVYAHKDIADNSLNNVNYYVLESASNTTITLEAFQATNNSQTQEWRFTAIRIGDKFSQAEADYIVEHGTNGEWGYRKWESGTAECWRVTSTSSLAPAGSFGGTYYQYASFNFPFTFINIPVVVANGKWDTGYSWVNAREVTTTSVTVQAYKNNAGSNVITVRMYAIGRWK